MALMDEICNLINLINVSSNLLCTLLYKDKLCLIEIENSVIDCLKHKENRFEWWVCIRTGVLAERIHVATVKYY